MISSSFKDVPRQESREKWFKSHLLGREVELRELYEMPQNELDLLMAETAELRSDLANRELDIVRFDDIDSIKNKYHNEFMETYKLVKVSLNRIKMDRALYGKFNCNFLAKSNAMIKSL